MGIDYERIKRMSVDMGRPAHTLIALAPDNDPFYITPARRAAARWFADLWDRLGAGPGMPVRKFHYLLVSQEPLIERPDGGPFENTQNCWTYLGQASRDARFLALVPAEHFIDRRNDEPIIYFADGGDSNAAMGMIDTQPDVYEEAAPALVFE